MRRSKEYSLDLGRQIEIHRDDYEKGGYTEMIWYEHRGKDVYLKHHNPKLRIQFDRVEWKFMVRKYWEKEWDKQRFKGLDKKPK